MKPHDYAPNGRFVDGMIVFGALERGAIVVKGYWIGSPDHRGASHARLNEFQDKIRALLALIGPGRRLQVQWSCDADYAEELQRYHTETQKIASPAVRSVRNERFARYWERMQARGLRRERPAIFLSIEIASYSGNVRTHAGLREHYKKLLGQMHGQFEEFAQNLRRLFTPETVIRPMTDLDHFAFMRRFLNPSLAGRTDRLDQQFDPALTLQENCFLSEGVGHPDGGFYLDGHFHCVLALSRWPQRTRPGIIVHLTGLPFLDYAITVNVTPAAPAGEIRKEEKAVERLEGEYSDQRRHSLLVALRKKERKIESLAGGFARPFFVTYIVRVWDATREGLRDKVSAVKAAIQAMDGTQYIECALPATAKKLFFASWPGWTHSSYRYRQLYAEDAYLADMLPFSATFTGHLATAEAFYDGSHHNITGVTAFVGGSPQHTVLFGMTGAGKSEFLRDLLLQTAAFYAYTAIIDVGLSHKTFTEEMGGKPIIIHPDAPITLNYLDTRGLPLTQLQLTSTVALLSRMIGEPDDAEKLALRQAYLAEYLHQLYGDVFRDWTRRWPEKSRAAQRLALAVHRWRDRLPAGMTALDAFCDLRERRTAANDEAEGFVTALAEEDITRFAQDPATSRARGRAETSPTTCFLGLIEAGPPRAIGPFRRAGRSPAPLAAALGSGCGLRLPVRRSLTSRPPAAGRTSWEARIDINAEHHTNRLLCLLYPLRSPKPSRPNSSRPPKKSTASTAG